MTRLEDSAESGAGVEWMLEVWMRRRWVAIVVFAVALAGVVNFAIWLPDLYRATATILVETQQVSQEFVRSSVSLGLENRIQRIQQELMSRERLAALIIELDLYPDLREKDVPFDRIIEQLRREIQLEPTAVDQQMSGNGRTIGFAISYSGRNPDTVAQVANVLATSYVEANTKIREGQAMRTADFLQAQLADVKTELEAQERLVTEFNLSHIGELPQQVSANLASLERLNTQLRVNADNQARLLDRRERFEKQLADMETAPLAPAAPRAGLPAGAEQAADLRRQLEELRRKFTDQYPEVVRVRAELRALEQQLAERRADESPAQAAAAPPADPGARLLEAISDIDMELKALKNEELAFRQAVSSYEQRVENVPRREEEFQALSRNYETTKERYESLLKRYQEAQLASTLEQSQNVEQFRILDPAIPPQDPAAPNRLRLVLVGFIFSIALAAGVILILEKVDTAFHTIDDLRSFVGTHALFSIPLVFTTADTRRKWRRLALAAVSIVVGAALILAGSGYVASGNEQLVRLTSGGRV